MPSQKFESPIPSDAVQQRLSEFVPESDKLALELAFTLRRSVQKVDAALGRFLHSDALTPGRWQVLVVLWSRDAPTSQSEIVDALEVSRATVSGLVDALRSDGHVTTIVDPDDRRKTSVTMTDTAREMTARLIKKNASRLRDEFASLNEDDFRQILHTLRKAAL